MITPEDVHLTPAEAAEVCGLTESQLGNWFDRYNLFPHKREGRGRAVSYEFRDCMKIAAAKALVDRGFKPAVACAALNKSSIHGAFLHNPAKSEHIDRQFPGTYFFTLDEEGNPSMVDGPDKLVCIEIRTWPLFDLIYPRFVEFVKAKYSNDHERLVNFAAGEAHYSLQIYNLRKQRWGA